MRKLIILSISYLLIISCSSVKKTEQALNSGNYDQAINIAIKNLRTNKDKKGKQSYVEMLENAFAKATERDLKQIQFLSNEGNEAKLEQIYNSYLVLDGRQEKIKPLLPLRIYESGRIAVFNFTDYTSDIISTKNRLADYLYTNANKLMNSTDKFQFRKAYDDFAYLDKISPNYKNTRELIETAHLKGTDYILVTMSNQSDKVIPIRLEEDLLNFSTYGLNDLWSVYHNNVQENVEYNFGMSIDLREINISPEQIREKQTIIEKQVVDGKRDLLDDKGDVVKDSLGNNIQVDKFKTIVCNVNELTQFKSTQVVGQVQYKDLKANQLLDAFPLQSEFIFEHRYATYNGDKNALNDKHLGLIKLRSVYFPTNEQMIYDSGENLKAKLKSIITKQVFR